jgi:cyclopropane fatty-acyl-phospholipid synthase-like methyltransferase
MTTMRTPCCGGAIAYDAKDARYFAGAREDIVAQLEHDERAALLDIGCGHGGTGALALAEGACGWAAGVELCEDDAAAIARERLSEVVTGEYRARCELAVGGADV